MASMQPCLLETKCSFPLRMSELQGTFNLNMVKFVKIPAYSHQHVHLFSDEAHCFSQSERPFDGNLIYIIYIFTNPSGIIF